MVPTRPASLHVTIPHIAPVAELTNGELAQIVSLTRTSCVSIAPLAVIVAWAEAWKHGIVCPIHPWLSPGHALADHHRSARQITGTRFETRPAVYHPHLSLAYATAHVDQDSIRAWLSDSDAPELPLPVTELVLVAQRHDRREITFDIVYRMPLAS